MRRDILGQALGRTRENSNSNNESHPHVESVHTRRRVVRGPNDLLTQFRR